MCAAKSLVLSVAVGLLITGCGESESAQERAAGEKTSGTGEAASEQEVASERKVELDGVADDWVDVEPLWAEAGQPGQGAFDSNIDIKQVYVWNSREYLYIFFRTAPSIQDRFDKELSTGGFCDLYLDTDNNPGTGCENVAGARYGKISGYEIRAWICLGVSGSRGGFVTCQLQAPDKDGKFSMSNMIDQQFSHEANALIAHGKDGVELAIRLALLGVRQGMAMRLLLHEDARPFDRESYSEGSFGVK